jgi:type II secretory pathway component PulC
MMRDNYRYSVFMFRFCKGHVNLLYIVDTVVLLIKTTISYSKYYNIHYNIQQCKSYANSYNRIDDKNFQHSTVQSWNRYRTYGRLTKQNLQSRREQTSQSIEQSTIL